MPRRDSGAESCGCLGPLIKLKCSSSRAQHSRWLRALTADPSLSVTLVPFASRVSRMDSSLTRDSISGLWDSQIVPQLVEYIKIPNKSPMFDAKWAEHGYMDQAVAQLAAWAKDQPIAGMKL